jgi:hypothetical protein
MGLELEMVEAGGIALDPQVIEYTKAFSVQNFLAAPAVASTNFFLFAP